MRRIQLIVTILVAISLSSVAYAENTSYQTPKPYAGDSPWNLVAFDLLIPGWGMYTQRQEYWGYGYAGAKFLGAGLIFVAARHHNFWKSAARAANKFQQDEPGTVRFVDPTNSSKSHTARDLQNKADSSYLLLVYAISFEILAYTLSAWHTYHYATEQIRRSQPYYQLHPEGMKVGQQTPTGLRMTLGWQMRY